MTAYLATSPGGADSVAIIAASSKVDIPFVMSMQLARALVLLVLGPGLAGFVAKRASQKQELQEAAVKPDLELQSEENL